MSFKLGRKSSTTSNESFHRRSLRRLQKWLNTDGDTESIRTINEHLFQELEELIGQYKTMRSYYDQLDSSYKKSKDMLICARYRAMKGMIKAIVLQTKALAACTKTASGNVPKSPVHASENLTGGTGIGIGTGAGAGNGNANGTGIGNGNGNSHGNGTANGNGIGNGNGECLTPKRNSITETVLVRKLSHKRNEAQRKRNERREDMSNVEMQDENAEIESQVKRFRAQIVLIKDLVSRLEHRYNDSKMYQPVARYHMMKRMIRSLLDDEAVKCNLISSLPKQHQPILSTM